MTKFKQTARLHARPRRLGTIYRDALLTILHKRASNGKVLDVGCHDGYFLSTLTAPVRVGVDLDPRPGNSGLTLICADGRHLPFCDGAFDFVYALDVIEHVEDDRAFATSLSRMVAPGGMLFLSTPSLNIRLTPPFITEWVGRKWGHLRLGYTAAELISVFDDGLDIRITLWNAPVWRFCYLALRFLFAFLPRLTARLVRYIARWDAAHTQGEHGYLLLEAHRPALSNCSNSILQEAP